MTINKLLIIIPCYNEQGSIQGLLNEIGALGINCETIVIDDGSNDKTYEIARALSPTIKLLKNLGIGGAVQTGIKYAEANNFDCCVQVDGDGQHIPIEILSLLKKMEQTSGSIIVGSRYIKNDSFKSTIARRIGSKGIAWTLNRMFKNCHVTDPTSGMRLMDRKAIKLFSMYYPHDYPEPISLAWGAAAGLSVFECDVKMRNRDSGKSSITGLQPINYMIRVVSYIILTRIFGFKK